MTYEQLRQAAADLARLDALQHALEGAQNPNAYFTMEIAGVVGWRKTVISSETARLALSMERGAFTAKLIAQGIFPAHDSNPTQESPL